MRFRLTTLAASTTAIVLLTSACGSISPAQSAAEEFEQHFTSTYPGEVLEAVTTAAGKWPWAHGDMSGSLVLADDTSPQTLRTIFDEVATWQPDENSSYDGVGVMANGLCLEHSDSQLELKALLRDRLYAEGLALQGAWGCPTWLGGESAYEGSLEELVADTATVRSVWDESDGSLRVVAAVHTPYGTVDHGWVDLPESAAEVLTTVSRAHQVKTFALGDDGLQIAVTATTELDTLQELADGTAGDDLTVLVMQGSLDPEQAAALAEHAAVLDHVRTVPGVTGADAVLPGQIQIGVEGVEAVAAAHEAATTHPDIGSARVEITVAAEVPDNQWARHRYAWRAGGTDEAVQVFVDLVGHEVISTVQLTNGPSTSAVVELSVPLAEGFPLLRSALPDGVAVSVKGSDAHATVEFTAARSLEPQDLTSRFTTPDLDQLAADWNAAL